MTDALKKRSFSIAGHRTSIALEAEFWTALESQAREDRVPLVTLVKRIDAARGERNLASALRVYALMRTLAAKPPKP
ncbi:MAG: ribbon-helix-helix domain-containing protein [Alphaproteobacteria bacterium]